MGGAWEEGKSQEKEEEEEDEGGNSFIISFFFVSFSWFFQCNSGAVSVQHQINFFFPNLHLLSVFIEFFSSSSSSSSFSSSSSSSSSSSCRFLLSSALGY